MNLESIMLSEISQTQKDTFRFHLYVESKEVEFVAEGRTVFTRGWGMGELGICYLGVQTCNL